MVHHLLYYSSGTIIPFGQRVLENKGLGVVHAPGGLHTDGFVLRDSDTPPRHKKTVSVVICSLGRLDSLKTTLWSLVEQTYKDFEVILITDKGNLSELRQRGLQSSQAAYVSFIDDDVRCEPTWLQAIVETFEKDWKVVGVTGPTVITEEYRQNRDSFKFKAFKHLYEILFLDGLGKRPSYLSKCGANSWASNDCETSYEGEAGYLEACNFTIKREVPLDNFGFSKRYESTGEWHEVDFALRLKKKGKLWYSQKAKVYHRPSQKGVYKARLATAHRWRNFMRFQKRWVKPSIRTFLYRGFVWLYFRMKEVRMI